MDRTVNRLRLFFIVGNDLKSESENSERKERDDAAGMLRKIERKHPM